jgi:DNA/RNA-binding domain of Phe-tRNA-synthetase-like protein
MFDLIPFISTELKEKRPQMVLGTIQCAVSNTAHNKTLWIEIEDCIREIEQKYSLETIKNHENIKATRDVYLACGKKPGRYRPAAEALLRRIVKGDGLYQINTLVDLVNLVSMKSGYSIGGFDADLIEGNVTAGIGKENEIYYGIGRGLLNIHNLPILRDEKGGIGTPTSDEERTALRMETSHFFMNINAYNGENGLMEWLEYTKSLLEKYCEGSKFRLNIIR